MRPYREDDAASFGLGIPRRPGFGPIRSWGPPRGAAGHALVQAILDDGLMPVHKVTITPRGRSLGSTMFIPKKDILTHARKRMLNDIAMGLGGRVAEELVLADVSSGAAGDIKQITKIARHMVCDWGMSELGPIAYGDNQDTVFLGREITRTENYSEETARQIDDAIHKIIAEQYERAKAILLEHRSALEKIAAALLEYETIEGKHVLEILQFGEIRSPAADEAAGEGDRHPPAARPGRSLSRSRLIGTGGPPVRSRVRLRRPIPTRKRIRLQNGPWPLGAERQG